MAQVDPIRPVKVSPGLRVNGGDDPEHEMRMKTILSIQKIRDDFLGKVEAQNKAIRHFKAESQKISNNRITQFFKWIFGISNEKKDYEPLKAHLKAFNADIPVLLAQLSPNFQGLFAAQLNALKPRLTALSTIEGQWTAAQKRELQSVISEYETVLTTIAKALRGEYDRLVKELDEEILRCKGTWTQSEVDDLLCSFQGEKERLIKDFETDLRDLERQLEAVQQQLKQALTHIETLEKENQGLRLENRTLKVELEASKLREEQLKKELEMVKDRNLYLTKIVAEKEQRIRELEMINDAQHAQLEKLIEEKNALLTDVKTLKEEKEELQEKNNKLETDLQAHQRKILELEDFLNQTRLSRAMALSQLEMRLSALELEGSS